MKQSLKVAKWEIKKTVKNKTFLISVLLTPIIFLIFVLLPTLLTQVETSRDFELQVIDDLGVGEQLQERLLDSQISISLTNESFETIKEKIQNDPRQGIVVLNESVFTTQQLKLYIGGDARPELSQVQQALQLELRTFLLDQEQISSDISNIVVEGFSFQYVSLLEEDSDILEKLIPGLFAAFILFGVFITGTMIFQSAIQEKKDKVSEIILSSISSTEFMQGKILGFFVVGLLQVFVWMLFAFSLILIALGPGFLSYLVTPMLPLLIMYAVLGYLFYAALYVGMGATIDDISNSGNFQGILLMIPLLPVFFITAILTDPNGLVAQIGSFIPFTTAGVMLLRLSLSSQIPVIEVIITLLIMVVSVYIMMKLAGKIFRVGMLEFGKNASFKDLLNWLKRS